MSTFSAVFCQSTVWGQLVSKCLKRTDFVYRCLILIVESTKVVGQDKKFKATSALEGIYTFLIFSAQHETIWPLWKTLNILKTSLYKSSLGVTSSFPVKKITYMVNILHTYIYIYIYMYIYIYIYIMHPENEYNLRKSSNLCHQPAKWPHQAP